MQAEVPPLRKYGTRGQDPDRTTEGLCYHYLENNYAKVTRITRISGIIKKSWCSSDKCGYSWACIIPSDSNHKNAVVFHFETPDGQFTLKVLLAIGAGRFKGHRGSPVGDLYFRIDSTGPFVDCGFGPKDYCPTWKFFSIPGTFDLSDEQKERRGIKSSQPENSGTRADRAPDNSNFQAPPGFNATPSVAPVPVPTPVELPPAPQPQLPKVETREEKKARMRAELQPEMIKKHLEALAKKHAEMIKAEEEAIRKELEDEAEQKAKEEYSAKHPGVNF